MKSSKAVILAGLLVSLTGCSTYQPFTDATKAQLHSEQLIYATGQKQLMPQPSAAPPTYGDTLPSCSNMGPSLAAGVGAVGGSVIGDLIIEGIYSYELNHAERDMQPLQNELQGFDIMPYFKAQLNSQLNKVNWLNINQVSSEDQLIPSDLRIKIDGATEDATILVATSYKLNSKFTALFMTSTLSIYVKSTSGNTGWAPLYQAPYTAIYYLPSTVQNRQQALPYWTQNNGELAKETLKQEAEIISIWMAKDLGSSTSTSAPVPRPTVKFYQEQHLNMTGQLFAVQNGFYIISSSNGAYLVNKDALVSTS